MKLTDVHAREIREAVGRGEPRRAVALRYGVALETVSRIVRGETHVRAGRGLAGVPEMMEQEASAVARRLMEVQQSLGAADTPEGVLNRVALGIPMPEAMLKELKGEKDGTD